MDLAASGPVKVDTPTLILISLTSLIVVLGLYVNLGASAYRDPRRVLFAGLLVSAAAAAAKVYLVAFKSLAGNPWTAEEIEMAAAIVNPALVGLAGELIGAAFMARMQFLHAESLAEARAAVAQAD